MAEQARTWESEADQSAHSEDVASASLLSQEDDDETSPSASASSPASPASPTSPTAPTSPSAGGRDLEAVEEERKNLESGGSVFSEEYQALFRALEEEKSLGDLGGHSSASAPSHGGVRGRRRPTRAASSPALGVLGGSAKKSPLKAKPPFLAPQLDQKGFPKLRSNDRLQHSAEWNESHHLTGLENHLLPNPQRRYFCRPQTRSELMEDLAKSGDRNSKGILAKLELPDMQPPKRPMVTADAGQPVIPHRHMFGGAMRDRDGSVRAWNDRWQNSMSQLNDQCHPDHRSYFVQKSLFEESPSQQYRRYLDQQIQHGVWVPIATKKAEQFPPMGGRLRGRSGTPVPFATP